jgi:ribose transport system permease protein
MGPEQTRNPAVEGPPVAEKRPEAPREPKRSFSALAFGERYALVFFLAAIFLFFSVLPATSSTFLSTVNLQNVLATQAVISIAALAVLVPLLTGEFDITIGAVLGMASYATGSAATDHGWALLPAMGVGIAVALCVGLVSGLIVAYLRANSIIITLGMSTLVTGLVSLYSHNETIVGVPHAMSTFATGNWLGIPRPTWVLVVVAVALWYLLRYTVYGRQLMLIGSSGRASQLVGVRTKRLILSTFLLSAALAGIAGILSLARSGAANPTVGPGYTLSAVAAVFLGATTIRPGQFNVPGTIVGVFFVAISVNGLTLAGTADWVDPVFNGAAVVLAVSGSTILANRRGRQGV